MLTPKEADFVVKKLRIHGRDPKQFSSVVWHNASEETFLAAVYGNGRSFSGLKPAENLLIWRLCHNLAPMLLVEVGRQFGISTKALGLIAKRFHGKVISFDGNPRPGVPKVLRDLGILDNVELIDEYTPWIQADFDWKIDFLLLDGDHDCISTLVDYHFFNYFLRKGGLVAFHDRNQIDVQEALQLIIKRDQIEYVDRVDKLAIYRKILDREMVYFQKTRPEGWPESKGVKPCLGE